MFSVSITRFILKILSFAFLVTPIFMINNGIKSLTEANLFDIRPLRAHIFLIIIKGIDIVVCIIGMAAQPTGIFAVVMYFLWKMALLTIYIAMICFYIEILKLRKISN